GISLLTINSSNLSLLATLNLPLDAVARITAAVHSGLTVLVPSQTVDMNGVQKIAWLEFNSTTGEMIAVGEDGTHQGIALYTAIYSAATGVVFTYLTVPPSQLFTGPTPKQIAKGIVEGLIFAAIVGFFFEEIILVGIISTILNGAFD